MNIFAVHNDAATAARELCLKHVCKMVIESAQMILNAFPEDYPGLPICASTERPYQRTHVNHPCSLWVKARYNNWSWLLSHGYELGMRFQRVYGKVHACTSVFLWASSQSEYLRMRLAPGDRTDFVLCMPDKYKRRIDSITSYRNYYMGEKAYFAKWESVAAIPDWWPWRDSRFVQHRLLNSKGNINLI